MTTPYRRGSGPVQTGASGASGASGGSGATGPFDYLPPAWNEQWILKPPVDTANEVDLTAGPPMSSWGASGASGATGGSRPSGVDGQTSIQTDRLSGIHYRNQNIVSAVYGDALPMLNAWENAGDALFNVLLAGFGGIEEFIETLVKILTGAEVDLSFISVGAREFLEALQLIFGPIGRIFQWVWENIGEPVLEGIFEVLKYAWDFFEDIAQSLGIDVQAIFGSVTQILGVAFGVFGDAVESILQPLSDFLKWLFETFGDAVESFLKPIGTWLFGIWEAIGQPTLSSIAAFLAGLWDTIGEPTLTAIFGTLGGIWNIFDQVVINNIVQFFANLTDNTNLLDVLEDVATFFSGVISQFGSIAAGFPPIGDVFEIVGGWVLGTINALTGGLFTVITQAISGLIEFASKLPVFGALISAFIPPEWRNVTGSPAASVADLKEYGTEILNTRSVLNAENLQGQIPPDLLPVVSPGSVGDTRPNLVADSGFRSAAAVQAGSGWSWDSTVSRTSGDGGSAKVVGDGGVKQMFSNLVAVSPGQELECAVYARWTKPSDARPTISVGLRGYINDQVVFTQAVASRTNVVQNSSGFAGNVGGWVEVKGNYAIPATQGLTHVRLLLSVLNAPAGTSVWFDEASLRKVSLIGQELVQGSSPGSNLADDIENSIGTADYQALLDRVAKKTGASLTDVQNTIEDFLDGDSTISGDQIRAGQISSAYINELRQTWDKVHQGVTGNLPAATGTIDSAFAALDGWRTVISSAGGGVAEANAAVAAVAARIDRLEKDYTLLRSYAGQVGADARTAILKVGGSPTAPVEPPQESTPNFKEVSDNFDNRTSLGSNWSASFRDATAVSLTIPDNTNVAFNTPQFYNFHNTYTAVYAAGNSMTDYQKVSVVLGTAPSRPAVGSIGYNDVIGRVSAPTRCIVARFYADVGRTVRLFFRNGALEPDPFLPSNQFGVFNMPSDVTAGSILELFIGDKAGSDQTKCWVRVGSWISAKATISATALSGMGRGWGFGGGNGLSIPAPLSVSQSSGRVNFWGAQDQT